MYKKSAVKGVRGRLRPNVYAEFVINQGARLTVHVSRLCLRDWVLRTDPLECFTKGGPLMLLISLAD